MNPTNKHTLYKICQSTDFLWPVFSHIRTESVLIREKGVRENPYSSIFYEVISAIHRFHIWKFWSNFYKKVSIKFFILYNFQKNYLKKLNNFLRAGLDAGAFPENLRNILDLCIISLFRNRVNQTNNLLTLFTCHLWIKLSFRGINVINRVSSQNI